MPALSPTPENVGINSASADVLIVQAGEAITQGQPVYQSSVDEKYYRCDSNASEEAAQCVGIATSPAAADGDYVTICRSGIINLGATLTQAEAYAVGATAGSVVPTSDLTTGDYITLLGVAISTSELLLDISITGQQI
jgi:hypothetical protein